MNWVENQLKSLPLDDQTALECKLMFACTGALLKNGFESKQHDISRLMSLHGPDWTDFVDRLHENRLIPVVYQALEKTKELPEVNDLRVAIRKRWQQNTVRMLSISAELVRLIKAFAAAAIPVIAFKGPALAMQIYGNINMRYSVDLDLLVSPTDHMRAENFLLEQGYIYLPGEIAFKRNKLRKNLVKHTHMVHPSTHIHVEIHFELIHERDTPLFAFDDLWRQRTCVSIAGTVIPTLPIHVHCLYLCLHGELHSWERLCRLYDVAFIFAAMEQEETASLLSLAAQYGQSDVLLQSLLLSRLLFGLDKIPEGARKMTSDRQVMNHMSLKLRMIVSLIPGAALEHPWQRKYWLRKRARWAGCVSAQDKWRYLAMHFQPRELDVAAVNLPDRLWFLYYFVRLYLFLQRRFRILLKLSQYK